MEPALLIPYSWISSLRKHRDNNTVLQCVPLNVSWQPWENNIIDISTAPDGVQMPPTQLSEVSLLRLLP